MSWQNAPHFTMLQRLVFSLAILIFVPGAGALAHHSTAAYQTKTTTLKRAVVKRFAWQNPHCVLSFDVKDDRGRVTTWSVEKRQSVRAVAHRVASEFDQGGRYDRG